MKSGKHYWAQSILLINLFTAHQRKPMHDNITLANQLWYSTVIVRPSSFYNNTICLQLIT